MPAEAWGSLALRAGTRLGLRFLVINPLPGLLRLGDAPLRACPRARPVARQQARPVGESYPRAARASARGGAPYLPSITPTPSPEEVRLASCML